jgi:hypothetical protein
VKINVAGRAEFYFSSFALSPSSLVSPAQATIFFTYPFFIKHFIVRLSRKEKGEMPWKSQVDAATGLKRKFFIYRTKCLVCVLSVI